MINNLSYVNCKASSIETSELTIQYHYPPFAARSLYKIHFASRFLLRGSILSEFSSNVNSLKKKKNVNLIKLSTRNIVRLKFPTNVRDCEKKRKKERNTFTRELPFDKLIKNLQSGSIFAV